LFTDAEIERLKALLIMLKRRLGKHEPDALDQAGRDTTPVKLFADAYPFSWSGT
jgi:hypothetical protein